MRLRLYVTLALAGLLLLITASCTGGGAGGDGTETRSFYMGFTPWPYRLDGDAAEVLYTYDLIQLKGDIVAHHFQQGVPWSEAYDMRLDPQFSGLDSVVRDEINLRVSQTDLENTIYLAVDTLSSGRKDLIGYWGLDYNLDGTTEQQPRPDNTGGSGISGAVNSIDWSSRSFADQEIADAFISYSIALIDYFESQGFDVAYYNYASEVSDLLLVDPAEFAEFLIFAERVYAGLKSEYPDLPLMVSAALKEPSSAESDTIQAGFTSGTPSLMSFVDVLGVSVYPYAFFNPAVSDDMIEGNNGLADLPSDWASQISSIAGSKPVAFTETGWIAEDLSIVASFTLERYSSENNQKRFMELLFSQSQALSAEFIIWFSLVDYSFYWSNTLASDPVSAIWRDTGLFDYDGSADIGPGDLAGLEWNSAGLIRRPALDVWDEWLSKQHL